MVKIHKDLEREIGINRKMVNIHIERARRERVGKRMKARETGGERKIKRERGKERERSVILIQLKTQT